MHALHDNWVASRVPLWMFSEFPGETWWLCAQLADQKLIYGSYNNHYEPRPARKDYAESVLRHVNRTAGYGGAWMCGWVRDERLFYLLWKDEDGDIQVPIECEKPWFRIREWKVEDWEGQCHMAVQTYLEFIQNLELQTGQTVKLAQGQRPTRH